MNKQKPQLNRVGRLKWGALMACNDSRAQQEERPLFFPGRTQPVKSHELFVYYHPPYFLFPSIKVFFLPCCVGTCIWLTMVAEAKLQFSGDPK